MGAQALTNPFQSLILQPIEVHKHRCGSSGWPRPSWRSPAGTTGGTPTVAVVQTSELRNITSLSRV